MHGFRGKTSPRLPLLNLRKRSRNIVFGMFCILKYLENDSSVLFGAKRCSNKMFM